jgi:hypothetical protein
MQSKLLRQREKINNQQSKSENMAAKTMAEVWQGPSAKDSDVAMAAVAAKATVEGNGCDEGNSIVDDNGNSGGARAMAAAMAAVRAEQLR